MRHTTCRSSGSRFSLAAHDLSVKRLTVSTLEFHWVSSTARSATWRLSGPRFRCSSFNLLRQPRGLRPGGQAAHGFDVRAVLYYVNLAAPTTGRSSGSWFRRSSCMVLCHQYRSAAMPPIPRRLPLQQPRQQNFDFTLERIPPLSGRLCQDPLTPFGKPQMGLALAGLRPRGPRPASRRLLPSSGS